MLFTYDKKRNEIVKLEETTFSTEELTEPKNIQKWVRKNPSILSEGDEEDIMIINEQTESSTLKRLDLLGVDKFGDIVVIELKRDLAEKMTELQAITYASSYIDMEFNRVCKIYARYLEKYRAEFNLSHDTDFSEEAETILRNFCSSIAIPEDFNGNQRLILVAGGFSEDLRSAVTWLILRGIRIECVELDLYKHNEELFIHPKRILPTPAISENIVRVRLAEEEADRKRVAHQKWEGEIEDHYQRLNPPLGNFLRSFVEKLPIEPTKLTGSGFHLVNGDRRIMVSPWRKGKIEFRFSRAQREDVEKLLEDLNITSVTVKAKSDIESHGLENPTPSIDYTEDSGPFENIERICRKWLNI